MYNLYGVGERSERCCTRAYISLGINNSPSIENLNFLMVKNKLITSIIFPEKNVISIICITSQCAIWCQKVFRYPRIPQPWTYCS